MLFCVSHTPGWCNGSTAEFGSANLGSNPSPGTTPLVRGGGERFYTGREMVKRLPLVLVLLLVLSPLLVAAAFTSFQTFRDLNDFTLSKRGTIAFLAATTLKERLDRVIDVGISFATRVQFRNLIASGKWEEAIKILESAPKDFSYIDRATLFDPQGLLKAATPLTPEISAVIGKDFSYRDYYQGVSKNWEPYVAEAIKPAVPLGYNLVPVAIPIKSEAGEILGILLLSIKLDTVSVWSRGIDVGPAGFVYVVDQKGQLIAHPTLLPAEEIVDFSSVPAVQKVLKGERGVEVLFNPIENEERITAYESVPQYGWGVVVVQPTRTAFVERNKTVASMVAIWAFVILAFGFFTYRVLKDRAIIRAQRDRERTFLESIGDGIFAIDRSFNITLWNKAASELTGWSQEEAIGKPMREIVKFVRESDKKENIVFIEEAMLYGEPRPMEPHTMLMKKNGQFLYVGDSAAPIFDSADKVSGAIIVFRDITKEQEIQKLREEFSSLASHQLKAPVTVIKGYTALLLEKGGFNKEDTENLEIIQKSANNMNDLVNALLNVSRIELGQIGINPEPAYLPDIVDGVLQEIAPQIKGKKMTLEKNYGKETPSLNLDLKLTQAILRNLLSNAVKYTPARGKIGVTVQKEERDLLLKVSDTGYGIPKDQQEKMFTKFFRAENVSEKEPSGTGLGLYVVKSVVEQSGGKIWFESEENKGTTFYVSIPLEGMKKKEGVKGLS